jgi:hypothetical protein
VEVDQTVAAIAAKSDVKGQTKHRIEEVKGKAGTTADRAKVPAALLGALPALLIFAADALAMNRRPSP